MGIVLDDQQITAVNALKNGSILHADVGTGKSRAALAYYYIRVCQGGVKINGRGSFHKMRTPRDLVIITTAKKRDGVEWDRELADFILFRGYNDEFGVNITIDSWNNITKYRKVFGSFFIFDEQRLTGSGPWVKSFYDIARKNKWILLSATPGDKWIDYAPVFIANGFYKNKTDFKRQHCVFARFSKYEKIEGYMNEGMLLKHKRDITVTMVSSMIKTAEKHHQNVTCRYDRDLYRLIFKERWDPYDNEPIEETGKLLYVLRKAVNDDPSRISAVREIFEEHPRVIIFYNYTYELDRLRWLFKEQLGVDTGEWNGQVHTGIPQTERWAYLVQYIAGCEGWNCIDTDTLIFYSMSYSYRQTFQAEGRIDRRNTPFKDLYYYKLRSMAPIDRAIEAALKKKEDFNKEKFLSN